MEDAMAAGDDNDADAVQQSALFDNSPEIFNARGVRSANWNPNCSLPPRDNSNFLPGFLNAFGHVTRNDDGVMPKYVAAIEHWQKNISPDILDMVYGERGWIALHLFDGGTLQRLADAKNGNEIENSVRQYILGFPSVSQNDVKVMVSQPRCQFLAASNKHAPPRIVFVWVRDGYVRDALIRQQTHDISDVCTFHATTIDHDIPSWMRRQQLSEHMHAIANVMYNDEFLRTLVIRGTPSDPRSTNKKVFNAVRGVDVKVYNDPANEANNTELAVYFAPITDDYRLSQEIKERIRILYTKFKFGAFIFDLSWEHHKGMTVSLFCPLCLLDDHPVHRCPFPFIRDWQGPGIDHSLTKLLSDRGLNVNSIWDEAYLNAVPQDYPIPPENDGYESDEKIAANNRHPWYYTPSSNVNARSANRYSLPTAGPSYRGNGRGFAMHHSTNRPKVMLRVQADSQNAGYGYGRGRGRGGRGRRGRGRGY
ncbi:hypothetical protein AAF712_010450 [Marasmius tenuissimus]|uniref:Uncharacterized protein n=1 Tax=Marasmius tenuissimus TaxID=585030 RepID=A0ABR2ZNQ3_9AGAR